MTRSERVLITDGEERSVLAASRGLALHGYAVTVTASDRFAVAHWSRTCARRVLVPSVASDVAAFLNTLVSIVSRVQHAVLLPGTDAALLAVSHARERLEPRVTMGLPSHAAVLRSTDKRALVDACRAVGLDLPTTICCDSEEEATEAVRRIGLPLLVKPVRSVVAANGGLATRPSSLAENLPALQRAIAQAGRPYLLQRLERGGTTYSFAGVLAGGRLLAHVFSRYHRTWPPRAGAASFSQVRQAPAGLAERAEEIAAQLGWHGVFELELLRLPSGRLLAIDFNPRVYGSLALAISTGVNLPALWCNSLLGKSPPPSGEMMRRPKRVSYRREDTELRHALAAVRARAVRDALDTVRPQRGVAHAYFRADDPLPALARAIVLARTVVRRRYGTRHRRNAWLRHVMQQS